MKTKIQLIALIMSICLISACKQHETYADQKKKQVNAIRSYISKKGIKVISEADFHAAGDQTDTTKNEFVLFENSGIYLQIVRKGAGEKIKSGETAVVLVRFSEYNLLIDADRPQLTNNIPEYASIPDKMTITNLSGTYTGSFITGGSLMASIYKSLAVPGGWLIPLAYVNIGRQTDDKNEIAKIKVIVPDTQGQASASQHVYPCLYEITYQRGR